MQHEEYNGEVLKKILKNRVNMNSQKHMYTHFREGRRREKEMQKLPASSRVVPVPFEMGTVPPKTQSSRRKSTNFKAFCF